METYEVKDRDDEIHTICAETWTFSTEGVKFYSNKQLIAWFVGFKYVKQVEEE